MPWTIKNTVTGDTIGIAATPEQALRIAALTGHENFSVENRHPTLAEMANFFNHPDNYIGQGEFYGQQVKSG